MNRVAFLNYVNDSGVLDNFAHEGHFNGTEPGVIRIACAGSAATRIGPGFIGSMTRAANVTAASREVVFRPLEIPLSARGRHSVSPLSDDAHYLERYVAQQLLMRSVLEFAGFRGMSLVVENGCFFGGWSWALSELNQRVLALDIDENALMVAQEFADHNGLSNIEFRRGSASVPSWNDRPEGCVTIGVLQVMPADAVREFFATTAAALSPGGLLLCNTARVELPLEWILTGNSRHAPGWRGKAGAIRSIVKGICMKKYPRDGRAYCVRPQALIRLAESHGFRILRDPDEFARLSVFDALERSVAGGATLFRHQDWYLFQAPGRSAPAR